MTQAYPLQWPEGWPSTPAHHRKRNCAFKTTFDKARRELFDELRRMDAKSIILSTNIPLRQDGMPYADYARRIIPNPGVAIYFTLRGRQMTMARDCYDTIHDNLRSLGLAIEHLRGLERHGGSHMMERAFTGFVALAAPTGKRDWRTVLEFSEGDIKTAEAQFRQLAKRHHPDVPGGSAESFAEISNAIEEARREIGR